MKERLEYEDNLKDLKKRININEKNPDACAYITPPECKFTDD